MSARICAFKGCSSGEAPTRQPIIEISAFGKRSRSSSGRMILGLALCEECAAKAKPSDFISDEGWKVLRETFYKQFHREPSRRSLRVAWQDFMPLQDFIAQKKAMEAEQTKRAMEMAKAGKLGIVEPC